ncbi:MAG TPA: cation:proton antiporter [Oscillospiraceae bacterium]|nr:cation:proton antiporter [Oscillospiraceae bacterium]HPF55328.1 cation:proton antiporter [Clostridiales bacterium]HPK36088.1 cation:proton antiporter [Oscillospiraceae bacterium]HPR76499.1 cation:proton antiporter [Oscillospiraceae bacterium]
MSFEILLYVAIIMVGGLLFGRLGKFIKLPNVTGYLVAGLIIGLLIHILPQKEQLQQAVDQFSVVSEMALGFIAFSVGIEFKFKYFKQVGAAPIVIANTEAFGAVILVTATLLIFGVDPKLSILLGAIAAATAPAQTILVIQQYKSKGLLTSMLLSVVALDDAVALIAFGFAAAIVKAMEGTGAVTVMNFVSPFLDIVISFAIGIAAGALMSLFFRWFHKPNNRLCVMIGFIFLTLWAADAADASPLLACMALGVAITNIVSDIDGVAKVIESFTPPIYMIFFVISGAGFDVGALAKIGLIGAIYIVMRVAGKWLGAWFGGKVTKSDETINKYLGPTLMPQAGVAIGLIIAAKSLLPAEYASQLQTIILGSTFVYSIIGPSVAKSALVKAGNIILPDKKKAETPAKT